MTVALLMLVLRSQVESVRALVLQSWSSSMAIPEKRLGLCASLGNFAHRSRLTAAGTGLGHGF
jgi:hypothetical protein